MCIVSTVGFPTQCVKQQGGGIHVVVPSFFQARSNKDLVDGLVEDSNQAL